MYNPNILGFNRNDGPFLVPLMHAKDLYGRLPSSYSLLSPQKSATSETEGRDPSTVLNLDLGYNIKRWLAEGKERNLKPFVLNFFSGWNRDYRQEFGISTDPLQNLNDPESVAAVLAAAAPFLDDLSSLDVRALLLENGIFRKDTLNSIASDKVIEKGMQAVGRKMREEKGAGTLNDLHSRLKARQIYDRLPFLDSSRYPLSVFTDEVATALGRMSQHICLPGSDRLRFTCGRGVEFAYAPRDLSYLQLGKVFGDCTSHKKYLQMNCEIENIYWTVFSWVLDCNYQILVVTIDGKPVIKCHILPYFVQVPQTGLDPEVCLFIDAIETVPQFRLEENAESVCKEKLGAAFHALLEEVKGIADRMGIHSVYSERFSNTAWVRHELEKFPEIFLDTKRINKIDELEDVYYCALRFCTENGYQSPDAVFMELQARNTFLIPESTIGSCKSFGIIRGSATNGLPAKFAFGV